MKTVFYPKDWKQTTIGDLFSFINGYAFYTLGYADEGYKVIDLLNISLDGKLNITEKDKYISDDVYKTRPNQHLKKDDIVIIMTDITPGKALLGKTAIIDKSNTYALNQRVGCLRSKKVGEIYVSFFSYLLNYWEIRSQLVRKAIGTAQFYVNTPDIKKVQLPLPPLEEQKKIAQVLSTWDEAIDVVEKLIEKKKDQKKVLAVELFSGSRRLVRGSSETQKTKYGDIPIDWKFLPISKVAKVNKTSLGKSTQYESYKYVDLSSVSEGVISLPDKEIIYKELPSRARRIIQKGDVIFSTVRPNLLGYAVVDFDTSNHLCSTGFAVVTPNDESDTNFIYQQLYSSLFQRQVFARVTGSNYPAINSSDFNNIRLNWPTDKNERKEIGDLLARIELEVQLLYNKRKLLKKQKKGLMQRLLTGKVRVN